MRSIILICFFLAFSCKEQSRSRKPDALERNDDTINPKRSDESAKPKPPGLIWLSDNIKIYGDTTIEKSKIGWASIKFAPYISFNDFLAEPTLFERRKAKLEWASNKAAKKFKTRIENAYEKDEAHFAGHYVLAYWGCGSPCQSGVIIDRNTGAIFDLPPAALGYAFERNSRMLIVNKPDSLGFFDDCIYCKPEIHIWDESRKDFIERSPELK